MKYVAILRGIGPSNPNMHGSKLKSVLEGLGFTNVQSLLSSGNVVFESDATDPRELERRMEEAWPLRLGFTSSTVVRSQEQLEALVDKDPYKDLSHNQDSYLLVTFFKQPPASVEGKYYTDLGVNALCSAIELGTTTDFMPKLEKRYGKEITSRTWLTIHRILKRMAV